MARKNLWLSGLCLLALGLMGLVGDRSSDGGAVAVGDREAQVIMGGQYCPKQSQITYDNICATACPYVLCAIYYNGGSKYDVKDKPCGSGDGCGACYEDCGS